MTQNKDIPNRKLLPHLRLTRLVAIVFLFGITTVPAVAQDAVDYFQRNCASCHTIGGGRLTGPDLKHLSERQERDWLIDFILDPKAVINRGDPYAVKLKQESREVIMPTLPGMTVKLAGTLLDLIDAESQLDESQFVGLQMTDAPFTANDIEKGRLLFAGLAQLENGGSSCISCHTVNGLGGLSGGRLGPDLTLVFERLHGRRSLASWLLAPATTTMQPLFSGKPLTQNEIQSLVAYFENSAKEGGNEESVAVLYFFLMSMGGALFVLVLFDVIWRKRFRAVRKPQVQSAEIIEVQHEH